MFKEIVDRLLSFPQRGRIKVDFDLKRKTFHLSIPIFSSPEILPKSVKDYVEARQGFTFKPHTTSFQMEGKKVLLIQEVPFSLGFQETLRQQVERFWQMSKQCHRMLSEMAVEEKYRDALHVDFRDCE